MTKVDFYILNASNVNNRLAFVCRLVEKIYKKGHQILIHTDSARQSEEMDDLLWTWRQGSFIPHEVFDAKNKITAPVVINSQPDIGTSMNQVLVNLANDVPKFFSHFERVAEIVDQDEKTRQSARQRYRFYQDRGYPLTTHDIN
jgi:DNA polymerase-3 subunit chi